MREINDLRRQNHPASEMDFGLVPLATVCDRQPAAARSRLWALDLGPWTYFRLSKISRLRFEISNLRSKIRSSSSTAHFPTRLTTETDARDFTTKPYFVKLAPNKSCYDIIQP
jgi:hypothetical protein